MSSVNPFKSFLKKEMKEYIAFRQGYGFRAVADHDNLVIFDRYVVLKNIRKSSQLSAQFFLEMIAFEFERQLLPQSINKRIDVIHDFFRYLERIEKLSQNPLEGMARLKQLYYRPAIFTPGEVKRILDHLAKRVSGSYKNFIFPRLSHYTALFLQASCGLRISEAINLTISDFNAIEKTLYIRRSKFRKDRLIPLSTNTVTAVKNYLSARQSLLREKEQDPHLFLTYWKHKGSRKTLAHYFHNALKETGMYKEPVVKGNVIMGSPCTHSLRHSFAINTIKRWKSEGRNVDKIADTLATYMGHVDFTHTQVYLKALSHQPEILIFSGGHELQKTTA